MAEQKYTQVPYRPKELEFLAQFKLSRAEVYVQALHLLMVVDRHRQAIKDGVLAKDAPAGLVLDILYPIELEIARREEIVDSNPPATE